MNSNLGDNLGIPSPSHRVDSSVSIISKLPVFPCSRYPFIISLPTVPIIPPCSHCVPPISLIFPRFFHVSIVFLKMVIPPKGFPTDRVQPNPHWESQFWVGLSHDITMIILYLELCCWIFSLKSTCVPIFLGLVGHPHTVIYLKVSTLWLAISPLYLHYVHIIMIFGLGWMPVSAQQSSQ